VARANAIAPRPNGVVATRRTRHVRECAAACTEGARAEAPEGRDATEGRRARTDARERAGRRAVPRAGATIAARAPADGLIERARRGSTRARERRNRRRRRRRGEGGAAHDEEHTSTPGASNNRAGLFPGRVDGREADRVNRECAGRSSRSDARECSSSARASAFAWRGRVPGGRSPDPLSPSPEAIIIFLAALLPSSILAHRPPSFFRGRIRFCGETTV